jgi:CBS domain-containing protein
MLSDSRWKRLSDTAQRKARLLDVAVDLKSGDYPVVTHFLYRYELLGQCLLPWEAIIDADWRHNGAMAVDDLSVGEQVAPHWLEHAVLLHRDTLDALVLDTANRYAIRANDLWLQEEGGRLVLRAVDTSPWAVLRRCTGGRLGRGADRNLLDWKYVEFLRGDPHAASAGRDYHRRVARLQPPEIAHLADSLPYLHAAELLTLIPDEIAADALERMAAERQLQVFEELDEAQGLRLLALVAPNAGADLVGYLQPSSARRYLDKLPDPQRTRITELLRYPPDTVGGIMTNDMVVAPRTMRAGAVRTELADQLRSPDFAYYVYLVDDLSSRRLCGVVSLRDLFLVDDACGLETIMTSSPEALHAFTPAKAAARRLADTHFAALPVVDDHEGLLGAVTVDAAIATMAPESWRDQAPKVFS